MPHKELFLGGLSKEVRRQDLEEVFAKYGRITRCDIKYVNGNSGTAYGFISYEDDRDAQVSFDFFFSLSVSGFFLYSVG